MFPTHLPIFSLALWDDRSTDRHCSVLDVVPSRWNPRVAFDDALLTILSDFLAPNRGSGEWFDKSNQGLFLHTGFQHPDVDVAPGGAVLHTGPALDGAPALRVANGTLHLPNGHDLPAATFANAAGYSTGHARQHNRHLDGLREGQASGLVLSAHSAVVGVFQALIAAHHPYVYYRGDGSVFDILRVVADALARALAVVPGAGQAASAKMAETMETCASALISHWIVRPDRGWAAQRWVEGQDWSTYLQAADPVVLDAARAATNVLLGAHAGLTAIRDPKKTEGSAHLRLAATADRKAMDSATLLALAPALGQLKPQAAAKAQALASS
jgi:hypothetical protein